MRLRALLRNCCGHTSIEYAMIGAFIAIGIITALGSIGLSVEKAFADVTAGFTATP